MNQVVKKKSDISWMPDFFVPKNFDIPATFAIFAQK